MSQTALINLSRHLPVKVANHCTHWLNNLYEISTLIIPPIIASRDVPATYVLISSQHSPASKIQIDAASHPLVGNK